MVVLKLSGSVIDAMGAVGLFGSVLVVGMNKLKSRWVQLL